MTSILSSTNPVMPGQLVAGIDTHKNTHHVGIVDHLRRAVADGRFPATGVGYQQVIGFLHAHGQPGRVGVEGTGLTAPASLGNSRPPVSWFWRSPGRTGKLAACVVSLTRSMPTRLL